ncbi:MAG: sugar phosphate isomerase/epimerase family protein [Clostridia bacterium]
MNKSMNLEQFIKYAASEIKVPCVEFEDKHFESMDSAYIGNIYNLVSQQGLEVSNIAFDCSFGYPTKEQNDKELLRAKEWMAVGLKLGCKNFRIFAGWMGGLDQGIGKAGAPVEKKKEAWDIMISYVKKICDSAKELNLDVVIENHNHGGFLSYSADVLRLFSEVNKENLSLLLDTGNYVDGIDGIKNTIHLVKKHIHLKINEINEEGKDNLYDLDKIISVIKTSGFEGSISLEYEGIQDEFVYIPKVVSYLKKFI